MDGYSRNEGPPGSPGFAPLFRSFSVVSTSSIASEVEMAHDEVFDGPISESIPSSSASFIHRQPRRSRRDSNVSFTYFTEPEDEGQEEGADRGDVAVEDGPERRHAPAETEDLDDLDYAEAMGPQHEEYDLEALVRPREGRMRRSSSTPLLGETPSKRSTSLNWVGETISQKIYLPSEDLTAVITGFETKRVGFILYVLICVATFGFGYLFMRWLPRYRVNLVGRPIPLGQAKWVVIENEWGQFSMHDVTDEEYDLPLYTVFKPPKKHTMESPAFDDHYDAALPRLRYLDYRYIRFYYHPFEDGFFVNADWKHLSWTNVKNLREGLDADARDQREQVFGPNAIDIEQKTVGQILLDEVLHPFYIFQVASLVLWSLDKYYYYAACILIISVFSIGATVLETRSTMRRLREISHFECDIRVQRSGFWRGISSRELVPGDVFEISDPSLSQVPCDCLLLSGDCIVNESMLTGESVPVSKTLASNQTLDALDLTGPSVAPEVAKHFLFSGTKIIRARRPQNGTFDDEAAALAMVVRTGFNTTKGALVRSMLFPKPSGFAFYRDSFKYISVMAGIAVVGFIASLINFIERGLVWNKILYRALDLVTIVVPPALPATLTIGTNFALSRLKKQKIYCISPQRVNVGGKLNVVCFDKTGTLTEDGLDVLGVRAVRRSEHAFSELLTDVASLIPHDRSHYRDPTIDYSVHQALLYTMATCHSLRVVDDELLGDPLDLKMFQFTQWSFEEGHGVAGGNEENDDDITPSIARPPTDQRLSIDSIPGAGAAALELGVMRSFEFASHLRRSSVVVRQFKDPGAHVFVKGAPESMREICRPETLPADFEDLLGFYTHSGYRVIATACKNIKKLSWMKIQKMSRADAECDLEFLGFIIFENKLKPTTTDVIQELNAAKIRNVMCTGDNILTAISVARECRIIEPDAPCFVPRFVTGDAFSSRSVLTWEATDETPYQLNPQTLKLTQIYENDVGAGPYRRFVEQNYSIAVSGDVFRWIIDFAPDQVLKRMLVTANVFARMSPDEKHELVEKLQGLDYCCGFCGDGANDCGALKAADVGISLSEAEASVAAPFTSRVFDISCVPKLIKEGRAALVTSFCCFKYMSLYSAIQFISVTFLYASGSNLGDFQFLFIDMILILPIAIFMGWLGPSSVLCQRRPTSNLVSRKVLVPLIGQMILCALIQTVAYETVKEQPWYIPPKIGHDDTKIESSENSVLFLLSCYQYIFAGMVLSVGRPFRQPMTSNFPFVSTTTILLFFSTYLLFHPHKTLFKLMQLTKMSTPFKAWLLALACCGFLISWFAERKFFPYLARLLETIKVRLWPDLRKKRRQYKELLDVLDRPY